MAEAASNGHGDPNPAHAPGRYHPDRFYALRTVVFFPVLRKDKSNEGAQQTIESFVRKFGEVVEIKYLFVETFVKSAAPQLYAGAEYGKSVHSSVEKERKYVGCIIVVYRTTAGAYSAVLGVKALKRRLNIKRFLIARALWPLTQFITAVGGDYKDVAVVRQEREVLLLTKMNYTAEHLKTTLEYGYGPVESINENPPMHYLPGNGQGNHGISAVLVTFARSLDAVAFVACTVHGFPEAKLCIRDAKNHASSIFPMNPVPLSFWGLGDLVTDTYFESLLPNVEKEHDEVIPGWRNPLQSFDHINVNVAGTFVAHLIRAEDDYVPNIIIATADEHRIWAFIEVRLYFECDTSGMLSLPARYILGRRRWVSLFQLDFTKVYFPDRRYDVKHKITPMNHIFPHLYPYVFETQEHNFTFKEPVDRGLRIVSQMYMEARIAEMLRMLRRGGSPEKFPFLRLVDCSDDGLNSYTWSLPIIVISDSIEIH